VSARAGVCAATPNWSPTAPETRHEAAWSRSGPWPEEHPYAVATARRDGLPARARAPGTALVTPTSGGRRDPTPHAASSASNRATRPQSHPESAVGDFPLGPDRATPGGSAFVLRQVSSLAAAVRPSRGFRTSAAGAGVAAGPPSLSAPQAAHTGALGGIGELTSRDIDAGLDGPGRGLRKTLKNVGLGGEDADGHFWLPRLLRPGRSVALLALPWLPLRRFSGSPRRASWRGCSGLQSGHVGVANRGGPSAPRWRVLAVDTQSLARLDAGHDPVAPPCLPRNPGPGRKLGIDPLSDVAVEAVWRRRRSP
jgi:hypothetical protein